MLRNKMLLVILPILILIWLAFSGCATQGRMRVEGESGSVTVEVRRNGGYYRSALPGIPPGKMPRPGMCRIWIPGVPPGQHPLREIAGNFNIRFHPEPG